MGGFSGASRILSRVMSKHFRPWKIDQTQSPLRRRTWMAFSIVTNLGCLAYFKYADFFIHSLNGSAFESRWREESEPTSSAGCGTGVW